MFHKLRIAWLTSVAASVLFGWPVTAIAGAQYADLPAAQTSASGTESLGIYQQCTVVNGKRYCRH